MKSDGGQSSFSVLLFQDIAVIPILAVLPLLAMPEVVELAFAAAEGGAHADDAHHGNGDHGTSLNLIAGFPGWAQMLATLAAIGSIVVVGNVLTRPLFRFIAWARFRELFTAAALMGVTGIALLMSVVGLSPALGTFLAGVVLANSEYRHELESDIDPFRGLLLGLFFITVGASVDFALLTANLGPILAMTFGLMALKAAILFALALIFKIQGSARWLFTLALAQAGEFGFVLLSFTTQNNVIPSAVADQLLLVVALSMLLTPLLFIAFDKIIAPRFSESSTREPDDIEGDSGIIIAGHGRFGGIVNRMLRGAGFKTTVLDYSSEQLEMLRTFGFEVFFGDATRPDLLHAAGIDSAKLLVICIDDREHITTLAKYMKAHHPNVEVVARARDRSHVYELYAAGVRNIVRETFDSGVRAGRFAYEVLGLHPFEAERLARQFTEDDRHTIRLLSEVYREDLPLSENPEYVALAKRLMEEREAQMKGGGRGFTTRDERGWVPPGKNDLTAILSDHAKRQGES